MGGELGHLHVHGAGKRTVARMKVPGQHVLRRLGYRLVVCKAHREGYRYARFHIAPTAIVQLRHIIHPQSGCKLAGNKAFCLL